MNRRGTLSDTEVSCTGPTSSTPRLLLISHNKTHAESKILHRSRSFREVNQSCKQSVVRSGKKLMKQISARLTGGLLVAYCMSQSFHSDGECIYSRCMDPKCQWLTLQDVRGGWGGPLIPVDRAAMLTPLPSLSHGGTHPRFTKPRSLLLEHYATARRQHTKYISVLWF